MANLHGVETIEETSGSVAVTTIPTAIIGLVGTAPDAETGTAATVQTGTPLLNNQMSFTAKAVGKQGNKIRIIAEAAKLDAENPAAVESSAKWDDEALYLTLAIDNKGIVIAQAAELVALVAPTPGVQVDAAISGTGVGVVSPFTVNLAGGEDEPYPLNTPVVVVGTNMTSKLGNAGSLYQDLQDINAQRNALTIVVRASEGADDAAQRANLMEAIAALSRSQTITAYKPRILIAPGFSEDDAIAKALEAQAHRLRAIAYVDCESMASMQEVVQRRQMYGARVELLRYRPLAAKVDGDLVYRPASAFAAGLRARIDYEKGWWWSKSNQEVFNVLGVEQIDEFILGDEVCDANLLNMQNVTTMIRFNGFRHWGNRLCIDHPEWRFESRRRTADVIEDSIQEALLPYVDRPLDKDIADDILNTINSYLRSLVKLKAIHGGRAWLDEELNTAESLAAGVLYINYDFGPKSPMERLTLRVRVNNNYALEELAA